MNRPPRNWQTRLFVEYAKALAEGRTNYLAYVSVAAGKTYAACKLAATMKCDWRAADRVAVFTPTCNLVRQWTEEAKRHQLDLMAVTSNRQLDNLPADIDGIVATYQSLALFPDLYEAVISQTRTYAILDEPHHLGDDPKSIWGQLAKQALTPAIARSLWSGSPFRSKNQPIPFVTYRPAADDPTVYELVPDFSYSYGQAVADEICRPVEFLKVPGTVKWRRNGREYSHSFADKLSTELQGDRLRYSTWVDPINEFLPQLLSDAHRSLLNFREREPDAAGLILASDITQARMIEAELYRLVGVRASVVLSDDIDAQAKINAFRNGRTPWVIAVRMISEGVDIPRLRVLAFCANVTEELFFIQAMGRIVRMGNGPYGRSQMFFPADDRLIAIAERIEEEIRVALIRKQTTAGGGGGGSGFNKEFVGAEAEEGSSILQGKEFEAELVETAETIRTQFPDLFAHIQPAQLAEIVRLARVQAKKQPDVVTYDDEKTKKKTKLNVLQRRYVKRYNLDYAQVWTDLFRMVGCVNLDQASLAQLDQMIAIAEGW
jgi:superfamily II DNA or RNA helicase